MVETALGKKEALFTSKLDLYIMKERVECYCNKAKCQLDATRYILLMYS